MALNSHASYGVLPLDLPIISSAFGPGGVGILTDSVLEHTFSDTASGLHVRTELQLLILKRKH